MNTSSKTNEQKPKKEKRNMKNLKETLKTVTIAVLITAIASFILGMNYEQSTASRIQAEVKQVTTLKEEPTKK